MHYWQRRSILCSYRTPSCIKGKYSTPTTGHHNVWRTFYNGSIHFWSCRQHVLAASGTKKVLPDQFFLLLYLRLLMQAVCLPKNVVKAHETKPLGVIHAIGDVTTKNPQHRDMIISKIQIQLFSYTQRSMSPLRTINPRKVGKRNRHVYVSHKKIIQENRPKIEETKSGFQKNAQRTVTPRPRCSLSSSQCGTVT